MKEFNKKTVVVTGGTRGIGRSIVAAFREAGAHVLATGTGLTPPPGLATDYHQLDLTNSTSVENFCGHLKGLPRVDVLVNNAGINIIKTVEDLSAEEFDRVHQVCSRGPFLLCRAVAPIMRQQGGGRILNVASIWSALSKEKRVAYSTAKSGLIGLTRALAVELASEGILVNAISPGFTATELTDQTLTRKEQSTLAHQIPLKRFAQPAEIAELVVFMCSSRNTYITGQNIIADGGFTVV